MESIARIMVASTDLLEAEGRALKAHAIKLLLASAIGVAALAMSLAGFGFVLFGLFYLAARAVGPGFAALIFGAVALAAAGGAAFAIQKVLK